MRNSYLKNNYRKNNYRKNNYRKNNYLNSKKLNYKQHIIVWIIVLFSAPFSYSGDYRELLIYEGQKNASSSETASFIRIGKLSYDTSESPDPELTLVVDRKADTDDAEYADRVNSEYMGYKRLQLTVNPEPVPAPPIENTHEYTAVVTMLGSVLSASSRCPSKFPFHCAVTYQLLPALEGEATGKLLSGHFRGPFSSRSYGFTFLNEELQFIEKLIEISFSEHETEDEIEKIRIPGENYLLGINPETDTKESCSTDQHCSKEITHNVSVLLDKDGESPLGFEITASDGKQWLFVRENEQKLLQPSDSKKQRSSSRTHVKKKYSLRSSPRKKPFNSANT